ncbi:hypothetical protein [Shewanella nanhaiensis]|uniref:Uncharacterized protein n=1 Tax=Shewanella nanhaiensis TaxID=2864872 RepID=A0ABS7DYY1_9GAMM|nr:hypothetical protein [Shewanella nanhaiensis]MBW8182500.1 hypothetical protein [Shewanella nanhaiensis]
MRKVVIFNKRTNRFFGEVDLTLLNAQIEEMEGEGHEIISVSANTDLFGNLVSFTLLIELSET